MLKFKNQDAYEARFRALQIVDERAAVKSVNGVLPDDAGAITLTPANINAVSVEDIANIRGTFRINVTSSNGVYSADKTFDEIKAAYEAGQLPYVVYTSLTSNFVYTFAMATPKFISFESYSISDDTLETAKLRIFSYTLENGSNIEQQISPYNGIPSLEGYATEAYVQNYHDNTKQDVITDLETIRSGASKGATAVQPEAGKGLFSGSYNDLTDKPAIPAAVTEGTVSGWGFTKNTGTYSKPAGGIPKSDLAAAVQTSLGKADTALQTHQSLAALQSKSITDSGGYFTTDTVEGALQEIGAELAGINTLLGSGIQISFTLEGTTCTAIAGQTFSEWVGSGYKTIENGMILSVHPYSDEGVIFLDEAGVYALSLDGNTPVRGGDRIISGAAYVSMNWGG